MMSSYVELLKVSYFCEKKSCAACNQGFKNQKSWYTFFRAFHDMFAHTIMHLTFRAPQIVIRACVYANVYLNVHLLQIQKYFTEQKVNLRFIPLVINAEPSLGMQAKKETTDGLRRTKQPDNFPSTVFESNEHGRSFPMLKFLHDWQMFFDEKKKNRF